MPLVQLNVILPSTIRIVVYYYTRSLLKYINNIPAERHSSLKFVYITSRICLNAHTNTPNIQFLVIHRQILFQLAAIDYQPGKYSNLICKRKYNSDNTIEEQSHQI